MAIPTKDRIATNTLTGQEIFELLGGENFINHCNAKHFIASDYTLSFRLPSINGVNQATIAKIDDGYQINFGHIAAKKDYIVKLTLRHIAPEYLYHTFCVQYGIMP